MWPRTHRPERLGGFSLAELVLVMAIIATVSAMAVPRFWGSLHRYRVEAAARRMGADLVFARETARTSGLSQAVVISRTGATYTLAGLNHPDRPGAAYTVDLTQEYGASIHWMSLGESGTVTFNGYGIPDRGSDFVLQVGASAKTVSLNGVSGRVIP